MEKSTRYRRLRNRDYQDRYRFVDLPEETIRPRDERDKKSFWDYVNPDNASVARSWIKFAKNVMGIKEWLTDASLGAFSSLYAEYVNAYNQVYEAYALYKKGLESYEFYRDKFDQLKRDYPGTSIPDKPIPDQYLPPPTVVDAVDGFDGINDKVDTEVVPKDAGRPRDLGPPSTTFFPIGQGGARASRGKIRSMIKYELIR